MTSRQRMQAAIEHRTPDRFPIDLGGKSTTIEAVAYRELIAFLGLPVRPTRVFLRDHAVPDPQILDRFGVDTRYVYDTEIRAWSEEQDREVDEWGIGWEKRPGTLYFEPVHFPLREATTAAALRRHRWPGRAGSKAVERWRRSARELYENTDCAVIGESRGMGIFETAWFLLGLERLFTDFYERPEFLKQLFTRILEIKIEQYDEYLEAVGPYIQTINVSDDLGGQQGPLIAPEMYRRLIKPLQKEWYASIKRKTQASIFLHSCGAVSEFLPDLIEIGVEVLNPVQVSAQGMENTAWLKREFGRDIVFWGGTCDSQFTLPFGKPKQIASETRRRIDDLSSDGGFVFAPIHNVQPGTPPANVVALYETAQGG